MHININIYIFIYICLVMSSYVCIYGCVYVNIRKEADPHVMLNTDVVQQLFERYIGQFISSLHFTFVFYKVPIH